jgi:hypothetical protein
MKKGKYFHIPEGPADLERLWRDSETLDVQHLPEWLTPQDAKNYRCAGSAHWPNRSAEAKDGYEAEIEELEAAGLIVEQDAKDRDLHHFYLLTPDSAWYNEAVWSIAIYGGESPFRLGPAPGARNPVLTRDDVADVPAAFLADPFMIQVDGKWYMFFEVMNYRTRMGEIGYAASADGLTWTYGQIVLSEPFHLSYPYIFEWRGDYYMIPESYQAGAVLLYKALQFPTVWSLVGPLLKGPYFADASILRHEGKWWLFVDASPGMEHDTLRLYFAEELTGPWVEHPKSPLIQRNASTARPAGRILAYDGKVVRFAQNAAPYYGTDVRAFEATELTTTTYRERESGQPILRPSGSGWNACGMHHLDAHRLNDGAWIASVDGWFSVNILKEGLEVLG